MFQSVHYERAIKAEFSRKLVRGKVLILLGARRVGKTEFLKDYFRDFPSDKILNLNGEDSNDALLLSERTTVNYKRLLQSTEILIIDEAQNIDGIGLILKLIVDTVPGIKVVATGSSMFDLQNKLGEPLVGRKNTIYLFPLSQMEFSSKENLKQTIDNVPERLIYGSYPEVQHYTTTIEKEDYLREMVNSYLLKDILIFDGIRNTDKILNLLKMIALQIGKEVSLQELGNQLQISKNTVEKYLDLLSKVFVLFKIGGYSRNLRKEITKSNRWYFYDLGIRNALISNFNNLKLREDVGLLWENYLVSERIKYQNYNNLNIENYFWRTYDRQEIGWLEIKNEKLAAFEFKWNEKKAPKVPVAFAKAYPEASFEVINKTNYLDFIS